MIFFDKKSTRKFIKRRQSRSRNRGVPIKYLYLLCIGVLSITILLPMASGMSTVKIDYVVTDKYVGSERAVIENGILNRSLTISNNGLIPFFSLFSSRDGNVMVEPTTILQYPGSQTEIEITVKAEENNGYYEKNVFAYKYIPVLPLSVVSSLMAINPYLPIFVIELIILLPFVLAYFLIKNQRMRISNNDFIKLKRRIRVWL